MSDVVEIRIIDHKNTYIAYATRVSNGRDVTDKKSGDKRTALLTVYDGIEYFTLNDYLYGLHSSCRLGPMNALLAKVQSLKIARPGVQRAHEKIVPTSELPRFLDKVKAAHPHLKTRFQDRHKSMMKEIERARMKLDDALTPTLLTKSSTIEVRAETRFEEIVDTVDDGSIEIDEVAWKIFMSPDFERLYKERVIKEAMEKAERDFEEMRVRLSSFA